jgi:predicted DNA binding CopG/RHH family protein
VARIPHFKNEEEEADFWSNHSLMDYIDDTEPVEIEIDPRLRQKIRARIRAQKRITLRLDRRQIIAAKNIAAANGIPCKTLFQKWIVEGIEKERGRL